MKSSLEPASAILERASFTRPVSGTPLLPSDWMSYERQMCDGKLSHHIDFSPHRLHRGLLYELNIGANLPYLEKDLSAYFDASIPKRTSVPTIYTVYTSFSNIRSYWPALNGLSADDAIRGLLQAACAFLDTVSDAADVLDLLSNRALGYLVCPNIYLWYFRFSYLSSLVTRDYEIVFEEVIPPHSRANGPPYDSHLAKQIFYQARSFAAKRTPT